MILEGGSSLRRTHITHEVRMTAFDEILKQFTENRFTCQQAAAMLGARALEPPPERRGRVGALPIAHKDQRPSLHIQDRGTYLWPLRTLISSIAISLTFLSFGRQYRRLSQREDEAGEALGVAAALFGDAQLDAPDAAADHLRRSMASALRPCIQLYDHSWVFFAAMSTIYFRLAGSLSYASLLKNTKHWEAGWCTPGLMEYLVMSSKPMG